MSRKLTPLVCTKCGKRDVSKPGHTGTSTVMRCPDCEGPDGTPSLMGHASMCRDCCPTGHGTHGVEPIQ